MSARLPVLPSIKHPLERCTPGPMLLDETIGSSLGRPLPAEERPPTSRSVTKSNLFRHNVHVPNPQSSGLKYPSKVTERKYSPRHAGQECVDHEVLSAYVGEHGYRDIKTPSQKAKTPEIQQMNGRPDSRASTTINIKLEIDELEMIIRDKCRNKQTEVQKRFKDNDPKSQGSISREALMRVFVVLTGKPVSHLQFQKLLVRFGMENKSLFHYTDFINSNYSTVDTNPKWLNTVNQSYGGQKNLTASQVHNILKEKAQKRSDDMFGLIPQPTEDGARRLMKAEFKNAITQLLQVNMTDSEFEKLWERYDDKDNGVIDSRILAHKLGIRADGTPAQTPVDTSNCMKRKEEERQRTLDVERWLKNKFRQGYKELKKAFTSLDKNNSGMVSATDFCNTLQQFGLSIHSNYLDEFLARCQIVQTKDGVPYYEFIRMFQDRSETGMPHKILEDPAHRYNRAELRSNTAESTLSALEANLMKLFQNDFLSLLGTFHLIDKHNQGIVSKDQFRAVLEQSCGLNLTEEQYNSFMDHVPLDKRGQVRYPEFMAQFDTKGDSPSEVLSEAAWNDGKDYLELSYPSKRTVEEVSMIVSQLLTDQFDEVEKEFSTLEAYNSQVLTQETLYQLLKKFDTIDPPLSRGEIRDLWRTLITNQDNSVSWLQLIRQFGFSGQTNTYEDAGRNPPKYGDSDYYMKSKYLNSDYELILDTTRQKIAHNWDDLRRAFTAIDPYHTGSLSEQEFKDIVNDVCVQLSNFDLKQLARKHATSDNRISYVNFLAEFNPNRKVWQTGNDMFNLLSHPRTPLSLDDIGEPINKGLIGISARLRDKLSGSWKNLRRAFQKIDRDNTGFLALPEFRSVLQLANVVLNEDEVYHVMSALDEDLTGKLNYNKFLSELFRPESQRSSRAASRLSVGSRASGLLPLSRQSVRSSQSRQL